MDSLIASQTVRLGKLLRTLIEYRAELALIPINEPVRIWHKKTWRLIPEHPVLSGEALHTAIRGSFGEAVSKQLDTLHQAFYESNGHHFVLRFLKSENGGILAIEKLRSLPELDRWPSAVHNWMKVGGLLEVDAEELYASILKECSEEKKGLILTLEKRIKYKLESKQALIEQREWLRDFKTIEEALENAQGLHPQLIAINQLTLDLEQLKRVSQNIPVLLCTVVTPSTTHF